ncbi:cyanoexosortase C [Nodosilinea sp. LEGE 07088]|uniref:cyanoexosortase C n=1 Tax=Nodosilinea sp. LEGE 07088 TaxID=2777968 RepID=UPI001882796C|nr:cyanoexosortase C [Nodosilinea sp. LEGE 07088]MBE9140721.1 cyanoexosortase C [Nodosilinea sp. LEGE 07088]
MVKFIRWHQLQPALQWSLTSHHGRVVAVGLISGLVYWHTYLSFFIADIWKGQSQVVLNMGFLYLGCQMLWAHRKDLSSITVLGDDRMIGHTLILAAALWLPFSRSSISLQALLWMLILIGIAWSTFTPAIFGRFPLACLLILAGFYPDWIWLSSEMFQAIMGPYQLENAMAWVSSHLLTAMGQTVEAQARFLNLPAGSVEVAPGCSGYDMAFVLAGVSLVWGLFDQQHWSRIALVSTMGVAIALILNIPRILLMTFAAVYWGEDAFNFWHGAWGGQIFAGIMFTAYYYGAMAVFNPSPNQALDQ